MWIRLTVKELSPLSLEIGIRTINPCEVNKGFSSKFWDGYEAWKQTPEEDWKV